MQSNCSRGRTTPMFIASTSSVKLLSHAYRDSCSEDGDEPDADDQWEEVSKRSP